MNHRYNDDASLFDSEVDAEGKPQHQGAPCTSVHRWIRQGLFGNKRESRERFVEEFVSKPGALLFVPRCGGSEVSIRLFPEPDSAIHRCFFISAMTSSAGRPGS